MSTLTILLVGLVVVALLCASLSFAGRPWGQPSATVLLCVVVLLMLLVGHGCASDSGGTLQLRLRDDPKHPKPACLYRLRIDNRTLHEGSIAECPVVPVCEGP